MNRAEKRYKKKIAKKTAKNKRQQQPNLALGIEHHNAGRLKDAINIYELILQKDPNNAQAHSNLGVAFQQQGHLKNAIKSFHKALNIKPDFAKAQSNLGVALHKNGDMENAIICFTKAIDLMPSNADAHNNLGFALLDQMKFNDAVNSFQKALAIKPDFAKAHSNLGTTLNKLGKIDDAINHHKLAIKLSPNDHHLLTNFAETIQSVSFTFFDHELEKILLNILNQRTVHPADFARPIISILKHHPIFSQILKQTKNLNWRKKVSFQETASYLSKIPLFLRIIELTPIQEVEIERMLTSLRQKMLEDTIQGKIEEDSLPFASSLSVQCFTNEYVYTETNEETVSVSKLKEKIQSLVESSDEIPPLFIATLGAYEPLHKFSWAHYLLDYERNDKNKLLIERQISEPFTERRIRTQIDQLTTIQEPISKIVRDQYEENPYPRWIKTSVSEEQKSINEILRDQKIDASKYLFPKNPDILIAGCGTGQHVLITASRFKNARIFALDLSLSSIAYAQRKTDEIGISNVQYAQADINELSNLNRYFDCIESVGVLHHLKDPIKGWEILTKLLKPDGIMKIGLYSKIARQCVTEGRRLISDKGFISSPQDIRRCRQDIILKAEDGDPVFMNLLKFRDFYSLSECRDLLFHVQEHQFSLPEIEAILKTLDLEFLGFEMSSQYSLQNFTLSLKNHALSRLNHWHEYEIKNPDIFRGMYQFWCKKIN